MGRHFFVVACSLLAAGACVDFDGLAGGAPGRASLGPNDVPPDASDANANDSDGSIGANGRDGSNTESGVIDADGLDANGTDAPVTADGCNNGGDSTLVLYLPFEEKTGTTIVDCSGRGHNGNLLGTGGMVKVAGHVGDGLAFDGVQTCVDFGTSADFTFQSSFTIAAWARIDAYDMPNGDARTLLGKTSAPQSKGWRFVSDGTGATTEVDYKIGQSSGSTFTVSSPRPQPVSQWMHVAGVWIPNDHAEIYINGSLVKPATGLPPILQDTAASLYAGCWAAATQPFQGALDEVRIYARALTASEIAALAR